MKWSSLLTCAWIVDWVVGLQQATCRGQTCYTVKLLACLFMLLKSCKAKTTEMRKKSRLCHAVQKEGSIASQCHIYLIQHLMHSYCTQLLLPTEQQMCQAIAVCVVVNAVWCWASELAPATTWPWQKLTLTGTTCAQSLCGSRPCASSHRKAWPYHWTYEASIDVSLLGHAHTHTTIYIVNT